jgi:hypothetical protein
MCKGISVIIESNTILKTGWMELLKLEGGFHDGKMIIK